MPDWSAVADAVVDALAAAPDTRADVIRSLCLRPDGTLDRALQAEVESLVAAALADDLVSPVEALVGRRAEPGQTVGPWRLGEVIGEGGQGIVYRATRADGATDRTVALKRLRPGPGQGALAERLRAERRTLARLEHPGIARLYDGGTDADGVPYLVTELVDGAPITAWAEGKTVDQRVALFADACDAVAYAHARLVVHRDLKPSNLLVTPGCEPRLLDFGIAKILDADDGALTRTGGAMTPAYAAPEQLAGGEVTTATDVYALGVLLYEVLAGQRPHDLNGLSPAAAERAVQSPPPPPSAVAPTDRAAALRGDLDTIVQKALAPEPGQRYASADALADDLRRHLASEPVEARSPTVRYRAGRFVRRHRAGVFGTAFAAVALLAVGAVAFLRVSAERDRAETEAAKSDAVADFVLGILGESAPGASGRDVTVADALDRAAARADEGAIEDPEIEGAVRFYLGDTYLQLSRVDEAEREYARAVRLLRGALGPDAPAVADALNGVAFVHFTRGDFDAGEAPLREALRIARAAGDAGRTADVLSNLHVVYQQRGDNDRALALLDSSMATRASLPEDPEEVAIYRGNRAVLLYDLGRHQESLEQRRLALESYRSRYPEGGYPIVRSVMGYGQQLNEVGRPEEAVPFMEEAVGILRAVATEGATEPFELIEALVNQAVILTEAGRTDASGAALAEAQTLADGALTPPHPLFGRIALARAGMHLERKAWAPATDDAARAIAILTETRGLSGRGVGNAHEHHARALLGRGQYAQAAEAAQRARAVFIEQSGEGHSSVARADSLLRFARR